jgi:hypothetical protein
MISLRRRTPLEKRIVFDVETDGFLHEVTVIHCLWTADVLTGEYRGYTDRPHLVGGQPVAGTIADGLKYLETADELIGHNIVEYDLQVLQKLYPKFNPKARLFDTVVRSRLCFPDIDDSDYDFRDGTKDVFEELQNQHLVGSHSLKSWGVRLEFLKGDFGDTTDWKLLTPEMYSYCRRDVELTLLLYGHLMANTECPWSVQEMEQDVIKILNRQHNYGWKFNSQKAWALYAKLIEAKETLRIQLQTIFPPWRAKDKEYTPKVNRNGFTKGCPVTRLKVVEFNPNSRHHIVYWLKKRHGWKPDDFTDPTTTHPEGQPKVNEDILSGLPWPEAKLIQAYMTLEKRIGQLAGGAKAWLKCVGPDGRMHGSVLSVGCVTRRCSHYGPNMAQVPNLGPKEKPTPFGRECRELFEVPEGKILVGIDAAALEARNQAHYQFPYDNGALRDVILKGRKEDKTSLHFVNQRAFEADSYDDAKTGYYALLYGAGDVKLGRTFTHVNDKELNRQRGRAARRKFEHNQPGYAKMKEAVAAAVKKRGHLMSLDGLILKVRSEHSALNALFQSAGAIVMKQALLVFDAALQSAGLQPGRHYEFLGNIHDEWQLEVDEPLGDLVGLMGVAAIRTAGDILKCKCPLDGEYKCGHNWAETH